MSMLYLIVAILFEVAGTTCMKLSAGFAKPLLAVLMYVFYALCFAFLTMALKTIEVSTAYAIWSGIGTFLIMLIGILYFKESASWIKIVGANLVVIGVIMLHLSR
ncbi:MAG: DMT family transporter [Verrucomicrobiota bacterium]